MMEFKVGDKVEVVRGKYSYTKPGSKGIIKDVSSSGVLIDFYFYTEACSPSTNEFWLPIENIALINKRGKQMTNKSWSFNIISEHQINFEEIRKDLTSSNPIALVEFNKSYTEEEQDKLDEEEKLRKHLEKLNSKIAKLEISARNSDEDYDKMTNLSQKVEKLQKYNVKLFQEVEKLKDEAWRGAVLFHESIIDKASVLEIDIENSVYMEGIIQVDNKQEFNKWVKWATKIKNAKWPEKVRNKGKITVNLVSV